MLLESARVRSFLASAPYVRYAIARAPIPHSNPDTPSKLLFWTGEVGSTAAGCWSYKIAEAYTLTDASAAALLISTFNLVTNNVHYLVEV